MRSEEQFLAVRLSVILKSFGIPFHHVSDKDLKRAEHEKRMMDVIDFYAPENLVLASQVHANPDAHLCGPLPQLGDNIHHSFLPAFIGAKPYHQAYDRGVKITGATAHIVTDDLDTGPIIAQNVIPVNHTYTAIAMVQAGRDAEKKSGSSGAHNAR